MAVVRGKTAKSPAAPIAGHSVLRRSEHTKARIEESQVELNQRDERKRDTAC